MKRRQAEQGLIQHADGVTRKHDATWPRRLVAFSFCDEGVVAAKPFIELAQAAPHVVRSAVAHEHCQHLQPVNDLPQAAGARGIKDRREQFRLERLGIAAELRLAPITGQLALRFERLEQRREQRQRAASAFGIEPHQRAAQQTRGGVGTFGIAAEPEKIVRQPRRQVVSGAAQLDVLIGAVQEGDFIHRRFGRDPGVLAAAAALHGNEMAAAVA